MSKEVKDQRITRKKSVHKKDKKRTPLSGPRNILTATNIPEGWVARWINDKDARILQAKEAGYEFVAPEGVMVGDPTVNSAGKPAGVISRPVGGGVTAYLMAIEKEFYDAVQQDKADEINEREKQIKNYNNQPGRYGTVNEKVFKS